MIEYEEIIKERIKYLINEKVLRMEFFICNSLIFIEESSKYRGSYRVKVIKNSKRREYIIETNGKVWEEREGKLYEVF